MSNVAVKSVVVNDVHLSGIKFRSFDFGPETVSIIMSDLQAAFLKKDKSKSWIKTVIKHMPGSGIKALRQQAEKTKGAKERADAISVTTEYLASIVLSPTTPEGGGYGRLIDVPDIILNASYPISVDSAPAIELKNVLGKELQKQSTAIKISQEELINLVLKNLQDRFSAMKTGTFNPIEGLFEHRE